MGSGGGQQSSQSSTQQESELAKEQSKILKQREAQYQQEIFPRFLEQLKALEGPTAQTNIFQQSAKGINTAFDASKSQFSGDMAKRGLSGSGVEGMGMASMLNAKSSALGNAYGQSAIQKQQQMMQALQMGGTLSPTPTQAAPVLTDSHGSSSGWNFSALWG